MRGLKRFGSCLISLSLIGSMTVPLGWENGRALANVPRASALAPPNASKPTSSVGQKIPAQVTIESRGHLRNEYVHLEYASMTVTPLQLIRLDNRATLAIPVNETLKLDGTWTGSAQARAELTLLNQKIRLSRFFRKKFFMT